MAEILENLAAFAVGTHRKAISCKRGDKFVWDTLASLGMTEMSGHPSTGSGTGSGNDGRFPVRPGMTEKSYM